MSSARLSAACSASDSFAFDCFNSLFAEDNLASSCFASFDVLPNSITADLYSFARRATSASCSEISDVSCESADRADFSSCDCASIAAEVCPICASMRCSAARALFNCVTSLSTSTEFSPNTWRATSNFASSAAVFDLDCSNCSPRRACFCWSRSTLSPPFRISASSSFTPLLSAVILLFDCVICCWNSDVSALNLTVASLFFAMSHLLFCCASFSIA